MFRSLHIGRAEMVLGYFCRTGDWAAFQLWEFRRPNPGAGAVANTKAPYSAIKQMHWHCADVNADEVEHFFDDIDALMTPDDG